MLNEVKEARNSFTLGKQVDNLETPPSESRKEAVYSNQSEPWAELFLIKWPSFILFFFLETERTT